MTNTVSEQRQEQSAGSSFDDAPPRVRGIIESAIYVDDMQRSIDFYRDVVGLPQADQEVARRLNAMVVGPYQVLLICSRGGAVKPIEFRGGRVPPHDGSGPLHLAFGVDEDTRETWRSRLAKHRIAITGEVDWPTGGWSLYFDDPDGHVVELKSSDWHGRPI